MDISRLEIQGSGFTVPSVMILPSNPIGAAVIAHGYGGSKEEQLGLAWRVAEAGIATCAIDLRGHGEHKLPLDENVLSDFEAAVQYCRRWGKVAAIGHSLGGRLALISSADFAIGISPPLDGTYGDRTQELLKKLRSFRVRPDDNGVVFEVLKKVPLWRNEGNKKAMIIYGSRDVPEIVDSCNEQKILGTKAIKIDGAMHGDTYLLEITFGAVVEQLTDWFNGR